MSLLLQSQRRLVQVSLLLGLLHTMVDLKLQVIAFRSYRVMEWLILNWSLFVTARKVQFCPRNHVRSKALNLPKLHTICNGVQAFMQRWLREILKEVQRSHCLETEQLFWLYQSVQFRCKMLQAWQEEIKLDYRGVMVLIMVAVRLSTIRLAMLQYRTNIPLLKQDW